MSEAVQVGQVWAHPAYRHRWKVMRIGGGKLYASLSYPDNFGNFNFDGSQHDLGELDVDGTLDGFKGEWYVAEGPTKAFSKINPKTLRKRMRDQMAQRVLSGGAPSPNVVKT